MKARVQLLLEFDPTELTSVEADEETIIDVLEDSIEDVFYDSEMTLLSMNIKPRK